LPVNIRKKKILFWAVAEAVTMLANAYLKIHRLEGLFRVAHF